jgi:hypothetical protein
MVDGTTPVHETRKNNKQRPPLPTSPHGEATTWLAALETLQTTYRHCFTQMFYLSR